MNNFWENDEFKEIKEKIQKESFSSTVRRWADSLYTGYVALCHWHLAKFNTKNKKAKTVRRKDVETNWAIDWGSALSQFQSNLVSEDKKGANRLLWTSGECMKRCAECDRAKIGMETFEAGGQCLKQGRKEKK